MASGSRSVAYWPGTVPAGVTSDVVVSTYDILPTIKDLAEAGSWGGLDGVSLTGVLIQQESLARATYWYYPHHLAGGVPSAAIRSGRHKLIKKLRTGEIELYDIVDDPGELQNLVGREPGVAENLHGRLQRHIREMERVPDPPTPQAFPVLVTQVQLAQRGAEHQVLRVTGSARTDLVADQLVVTSRTPARVLLQSSHAPTSGNFALTLFPRLAQNQRAPHPTLRGERPPEGIGLAKDADNYLCVTYDHERRSVGWSLVIDGVDRTGDGEPEPLNALEGTVDLSKYGARLGMSVGGSTVGVYADQGNGWEFLFLLDIGGAVALDDPQVRREWRYAIEVSRDEGSPPLGGAYEIRQQ